MILRSPELPCEIGKPVGDRAAFPVGLVSAARIRTVYYLGGALLTAASVAGLTLAGLPVGWRRARAQPPRGPRPVATQPEEMA